MPATHALTSWIGRPVTVEIDRPLGSVHPRWPGLVYTVNYGFIPGTLAPDGDPIDAYVLGPDRPLTRFEGLCIAAIHRRNDLEGKLVLTAPGAAWSDDAIARAVDFQERFFDSAVLR